MKTIKLELNEKEANVIGDAVNEMAISMRTNHMTGVVMSEEKFLSSDISDGRRNRYLMLKSYATQLIEFARLA